MFLCLFENKRTVLVGVWFTFVQYLPTWTQQYNVPVRTLCTWPEKVPYLILTSAFSAPRVSEPSMYTEVQDEETWAIVLRRATQHDTIEFAGYAFDTLLSLSQGCTSIVLGFPHRTHGHLESGLVSGLAGSVEGDVSYLASLRHNEDLHWLRHLLNIPVRIGQEIYLFVGPL